MEYPRILDATDFKLTLDQPTGVSVNLQRLDLCEMNINTISKISRDVTTYDLNLMDFTII